MAPLSLQHKFFIFIGLISILLMLFFLNIGIYQSHILDIQTQEFQNQNNKIKEKINSLKNEIDYYESETYKDKYAKEVLNKLETDEKVIVLLEKKDDFMIPKSELLEKRAIKKTPFETWHEYFFGKEILENRLIE